MREREQGFSGISIKDTWAKTKGGQNQGCEVGMAGVGGVVGENGDNCT